MSSSLETLADIFPRDRFEYLLLSFLTYTQQNWSFSSKKDIIPIHMLAVGRSSTKNSYRLLMNVVKL